MYKSVKTKILSKIYGRGRGWAFSANDFLSDFKRYEIDFSLTSLEKDGIIRRCMRGIYDYPIFSKLLNKHVAPDPNQIANAIARKFNWQIIPSGDTALNYLGLSTQVANSNIYYSSGRSIIYELENLTLQFKHLKLKESTFKYSESAIVVQALKALGKEHIDIELLEKLQSKHSKKQWQIISKDTVSATGWVYDYIKQITEMGE